MGCAGSKAAPPSFFDSIVVVPWGVLGQVSAGGWNTKQAASEPDAQAVFVDPASVEVSRNPSFTPGDAGGAAGAIYRFLGIAENSTFPPDVVAQLNGTGDAVYKRYGFPHAIHVIHAIGPDFKKQPDCTREDAIDQLSICYAAVLRVYARDNPKALLRIPPISSGIYAGSFRGQMAEITAAALRAGFERMKANDPQLLRELPPLEGRRCELCLFDPAEAEKYKTALAQLAGNAHV